MSTPNEVFAPGDVVEVDLPSTAWHGRHGEVIRRIWSVVYGVLIDGNLFAFRSSELRRVPPSPDSY